MAVDNDLRRHLPLDGTYNVRDIGGYRTVDGRRTRWRTLFRADSLHRLPASAQAMLLDHGIRTIVDLRYASEVAEAPNVFDGSNRVRYLGLPLLEDPAARTEGPVAGVRSLADSYRYALEFRASRIVDILRGFTSAEGLPALVHCTAGKDRTGVVIALTLGAIGVPAETIAADYAASADFLVGEYFEEARQRAERRNIPWEQYRQNLVCPAPLMLETLDWLNERYGSVPSYLLESGLQASELQALRERLLTD